MALMDYIRKFRSIKMSHDIVNRIDYCYLAEFFRFIGILVCEENLADPCERESKTEIELNTEYSAYIYVGKRELDSVCLKEAGISEDEYAALMQGLPEETIYLYDIIKDPLSKSGGDPKEELVHSKWLCHCSKEEQIASIKAVLSKVLKAVFGRESNGIEADQLEELIEIYVEQKIWFHSMNLQYYTKRKTDIAISAKEAFIASHELVKAACESKKGEYIGYIYEYALLWCEVKTNTACDFIDQILYYPIKSLSERCITYCREYPEFDNAKILLGLCYEPSLSYANHALVAFNEVVEHMRGESFLAAVYYWMGKYYETFESEKKEAKLCYLAANRCRRKFRTCFKLAVSERNEGNYDEAINLFQEIIRKLELKLKLKFADSLELEYLFKAYTQQAYIFHKNEKYKEAIEAGKKALFIKKESIYDSRYFDAFYRENAEQYRAALNERLNRDMADWIIRDSEENSYGDN